MFQYTEEKKFTKEQVQELFLSVDWVSGNYPECLYKALMHSSTVLTVWDGEKLVGLTRVLDDTEMPAQIHYVLVHPEYQGKGIAGRMIEYIKENIRIFCISRECRKIKITSHFIRNMDFLLWKMVQPFRSVIMRTSGSGMELDGKHREWLLTSLD